MLELLPAGLPAPARGGFTTRSGGVSSGAWATANLAGHVADDAEAVRTNRSRLAEAAGVDPGRLVFAEQVHGPEVAVVEPVPGTSSGTLPGVDALVTRALRAPLVVMAADCVPVLLADAQAGVVAVAHAGRQGLAAGVLQQTLEVMAQQGAQASRTAVVLGPAVCGSCYELPDALVDQVEQTVPGSRSTTRAGTAGIDLAAGAEALLRSAGVSEVRRVGGCTFEQPDRFFSHRRDGRTGRHAGAVWLA